MKIRTGFVSNSSSSSFVAIVKDINIKQIRSEDLKNRSFMSFGGYMEGGVDAIYITTPEMLKYMQMFDTFKLNEEYGENDEEGTFTIYETIVDSDNTLSFTKNDLEDGVRYTIINELIDQNSVYTIKELLERYASNEQKQKFNRESKLKRILKDEN